MATFGAATPNTRSVKRPANRSRPNTRTSGGKSAAYSAVVPTLPLSRPRAKAKPAVRRSSAAIKRIAPPISERVLFVGLFLGVLYTALAVRLFYLQVYRHDEFVAVAEQKREKTLTLPARRGVLLDRNGALLVRNEPAYAVTVDPNPWFIRPNPASGDTPEARQKEAIERLSALMPGVDVAGIVAKKGIVRPVGANRYRTIEVALQVDPETGENVKAAIKKGQLLGVGVRETTRRLAMNGDLACHVLGFTGRDGKGLDGLEHGLENALDGEKGRLTGEFDYRGRPIPGTTRLDAPHHGRDVVLTLDSDLQHTVQQALQKAYIKSHAEAATAIVMDPRTGDILALANYPAFNVNDRRNVKPEALANRAVTTPFEPGSTLKTVTIAAALEDKKISPDSHFYCSGNVRVGNHTIRCAHGEVHRDETTLDVLRHSCNLAAAHYAELLGPRRLYEYEESFGFGQKTQAGLPGEARGKLDNPSDWSKVQLANIGFGQGISVTPLQLAAAYGAIANDGVWMRPRIVWGERPAGKDALKPQPLEQGHRVVSAETARQVRRMLQAVVDNGTGKLAQLEGYTAGGKTGTAQIAGKGGYSGKYVASFIGMAPLSAPKFVVLVTVSAPKGDTYGGTVAAPVFREITEQALLMRRVPRDKALVPKKKTVGKHDPHSLAD